MFFWQSIYLLLHRKLIDNRFPLNELPDVARIHIIRLMDAHDQVKLALSSKRMEQYIKFTKIRYYDYCQIKIEEKDFTISLKHSLLSLKSKFREYRQTTNLIGKEMKPWLNEDSSVAENAVNVLKRLQSTFPCIETGVAICLKEPTEIKKIFNNFDDFFFVCLGNVETNANVVDLIMDSSKKGRQIRIIAPEMPLDYSHPNAFKFNIIVYYDARWVRLEHLFSMNKNSMVQLGKNNFKCEDLNELLKYWVKSEKKMACSIHIAITEETNLQEKTLFEGLIVLKTNRSGESFPLIANHRMQLILCVLLTPGELTIHTYTPHKPFKPFEGTPLSREYKILEILQEKKLLEELGNEENQENIYEKMGKLDEELTQNGVYYVEEAPHINEQ